MMAGRFNGCGVWFLGIQHTPEKGVVYATFWLTFLFLPVFPLQRAKLRFSDAQRYTALEKTPLNPGEILQTYLYGWLLFPLLILGPTFVGLALSINEVAGMVGPLMLFASLAWMIFVVWQLAGWDQYRRLVPQKNILRPRRP